MFKTRYHWHNPLIDSIAYSLVAAVGLYALIAWLLNAAKDFYVLLFHSDPHLIAATLEFLTNATGYLLLAIFSSLLLFFLIGARL